MFYFVQRSIHGRRRESIFLYAVLCIAFAFAVVVSCLIPSTEQMTQRQRENTYGSWQLMCYDSSGGGWEAMTEAAEAAGVTTAQLGPVGVTDRGEPVAVIDEAVSDMGNFTLLDGTYPQAEDEILLVANQFRPDQSLRIGDEITVAYLWDGLGRDVPPQEAPDLMAMSQDILREKWDEYGPQFQKDWDGDFRRYIAPMLGEEFDVPADQLTQEQQYTAAYVWASNYLDDFRIRYNTTYEPVLLGDQENKIVLRKTIYTTYLQGKAFEGQPERNLETMSYRDLTLRKTYRVCGILQAYSGTWDAGSCPLPAAFVSSEGGRALEYWLDLVQQETPDLLPSPTQGLSLFRWNKSAEALYDLLLPHYEAASPKSYRLETTEDGRSFFLAENQKTGALERLPISFFPDGSGFLMQWEDRSYGLSVEQISEADFALPGLSPLPAELPTLEQLYQKNNYFFRINAPAFPQDSGTMDSYAQLAMVVVLTVLSACAILTVCLIQSKKRIRSLLTLRGLGLEQKQGAQMLFLEGLLFWLAALPGVLPGLLAAWLYLNTQTPDPILALDWGLLSLSAAGVTLALAIGLAVPLWTAKKLPLTGRVTSVKSLKAVKAKKKPRRSYLGLEWKKTVFHSKKHAFVWGLSCLMVLVALLTLTLSHQSMDAYRSGVQRAGRPDYLLSVPYGMSTRYWEEQLGKLEDIPEDHRTESYLAAEEIWLDCQDFRAESPILSRLDAGNFTENAQGRLSLKTDVMGLDMASPLWETLAAGGKQLDMEALESGKACVLLVPMYREQRDGELLLTYDPGEAPLCRTDGTVKAGDVLRLSAETHAIRGEEKITTVAETEMTVLAVVHCFPEGGVWPFGALDTGYTLLSGPSAIRTLYPRATGRMSAEDVGRHRVMQQILCPNCTGKTYFRVYGGQDDALYWNFAQSLGLDIQVLREDNQSIYRACTFQRLMVLLLGAAAELLLFTILSFLVFDLVEQERKRIGILRAVGLSLGHMVGGQAIHALVRSTLAVLAASLAMALLWLLSAWVMADGGAPARLTAYAGQTFLWRYPWQLHILLSLGAWLLLTVLYVVPYVRVGRQTIIDAAKEQEAHE